MWKKIIFILGLMLIWQALAHLGFYNQILLPPPLDIGKAFMTLISSGSLLIDVVMSLKRMLAGFVMAVVLGLTLATLCWNAPGAY
jgi:ABC-type nitrate/sulfonate/bicarbonate transport system permease component